MENDSLISMLLFGGNRGELDAAAVLAGTWIDAAVEVRVEIEGIGIESHGKYLCVG
jgi:hypothetical protein